MPKKNTVLEVKDLSISFKSDAGDIEAVKSVSFDIEKGKTLALVGESGSGKSVCALSILRLLPYPKAYHPSGQIHFFHGESEDVKVLLGDKNKGLSDREMRSIRGSKISMIFQEPLTALNPLHTLERQIGEMLDIHTSLRGQKKQNRILELLKDVGFPEAKDRLTAYPHEFSGGQRQRIMIAMALAVNPEILIADEPTTALDVTTQLGILNLLDDLKQKYGLSILLITHDLSIVRKFADHVVVMQKGLVVEQGPRDQIFKNPQQDYTKHLIASDPKGAAVTLKGKSRCLLNVENLEIEFGKKKSLFHSKDTRFKAVTDVSLHLNSGETLGVVGESGSGKTTLAMAILGFLAIKHGKIAFDFERGLEGSKADPSLLIDIAKISPRDLRPHRQSFQMVFQDPFGSLNPRMTIEDIIGEGIDVHGLASSKEDRLQRIQKALLDVKMDLEILGRYPHEFSGGQRQRIAIARALVLEPELLILDEPTSALDRSVQVSVLDLLKDLQNNKNIAYLFITHDLQVIKSIAHKVIVMKSGKVIETGLVKDVFDAPSDPYTKTLLKASLLG